MTKRKRTFGELKKGSYFWSAGIGSVTRCAANIFNHCDDGKVTIGTSYYLLFNIDKDATEFDKVSGVHWFTDKQDAIRCAYGLIQKEVEGAERHLAWMKERADAFKKNFLDC